MNLIFDAAIPFRSSPNHIARPTMRLAVLLCLCFFGSPVAGATVRVSLKLTCTLNDYTFSGTVFLMEHDLITGDDELASREFSPSTTNPRNPTEHVLNMGGSDFELYGSLEPYLKIRHNCGQPNGQTKEYRIKLPDCGRMILSYFLDCYYKVEAQVGWTNSHRLGNNE